VPGALQSIAFPDANKVMQAILNPLAPAVLYLPNDFTAPIIVVKRVGGQPDPNDVTDFPILLVSYYADNYDAVSALASAGQVRILMSPLTQVVLPDNSHVLIDSAGIYVGEQELPDVYADERRITSTYQLGLRRQFFPPS
jgi:hypothetical protein